MKKTLRILFSVLVIMCLSLNINLAFATSDIAPVNVEVVNHSIFEADSNVDFNKIVDGISFMAGNSVIVNGMTEYGAIAANVVDIKGTIEKDAFLAGNSITLNSSSTVRDIYIAGNNVVINGTVTGDVYIASASVTINGTIYGNVTLSTGRIDIGNSAKINGKLKYNSDAVCDDFSSRFNVETYQSKREEVENVLDDLKEEAIISMVKEKVISILGFVIFGLVFTLLLPKLFDIIENKANEISVGKFFATLGKGLLFFIVVPTIFIILVITLIGMRLGFALVMLYGLAIFISGTISAYVLGYSILTKLLKKNNNHFLSMLIGALVLKLLGLIPGVDVFVGIVSGLYGVGCFTELMLMAMKRENTEVTNTKEAEVIEETKTEVNPEEANVVEVNDNKKNK